jgi:OmpA family
VLIMGNRVTLDVEEGDGGRAGNHPRPPALKVFAAPSTKEGSVDFNTIEPNLFTVACWRMDDVRFDFDSSFVRPEAKKELGMLRNVVDEHPDHPLSVFGHADPTGDDAYNKTLSGRRARAVCALLVRDAGAWEDLYSHAAGGDAWGQKQIGAMLGAVPSASGDAYTVAAPGPGASNVNAIRLFQDEHGLRADGDAGPATRKELFLAYMDFLCDGDALKLTLDDFLGGGASDTKGDFQGCSEFNPVLVFSKDEAAVFNQPAHHAERDTENTPNRRVVIFFFPPGSRVGEGSWPCPRASEGVAACKARFWSDGEARRNPSDVRRSYEDTADTFACRFYDRLAMRSPCEASITLVAFEVRLTDPDKDPLPRAPFRITQGASVRLGEADDDGLVRVQAIRRPDKLRVEWSTEALGVDGGYAFAREYFVDVGEGDASDDRRLFNLGYVAGARGENVKAYQRDFGHKPTGLLADIREEMRAFHDGGARPGTTGA